MDHRDLWFLLPRPVRRLPADLAAVIALVLLLNAVVLAPVVRDTPLRIIVGLPFVLFVPGYAVIAALFPDRAVPVGLDEGPEGTRRSWQARGIDGIERVALSFGVSIAVVPLIGLGLNFTPWGIRLLPIVVSVSAFTVLAAGVGALRRWELPADERFRVPYDRWLADARAELFEPDSRTDGLLNGLLVLSVLLAAGSVGYAVAVPKHGEAFTEFYLLTEDGDGELVAANYPTEFTRGEQKPVVVGVSNHEHAPETYTIVVILQRVGGQPNTTTVLNTDELDRFSTPELASNETWRTTYDVTPTLLGTRLRLAFLLYKDDPSPTPTIETAYRELHLWINVSAPDAAAALAPPDGADTRVRAR